MELIIDNKTIPIKLCNTFFTRLIGLLGQSKLTTGALFPRCKSIHTCFMSSHIDVIILSENNTILEIYPDVKPFKIISSSHQKTSILELPPHTSQNLQIGEQLLLHNSIL